MEKSLDSHHTSPPIISRKVTAAKECQNITHKTEKMKISKVRLISRAPSRVWVLSLFVFLLFVIPLFFPVPLFLCPWEPASKKTLNKRTHSVLHVWFKPIKHHISAIFSSFKNYALLQCSTVHHSAAQLQTCGTDWLSSRVNISGRAKGWSDGLDWLEPVVGEYWNCRMCLLL